MPDGSKSDEVIFLELVSASSASKDDKESSNEAHVRSRKMSEEILSTQVSEEDHSRQPSEEILSRKAAKGILHRKASEEIPSSDGYTESISSGGIFDIVEEENVSVLPFGGFPLVRRILEKAGVTFENSKDLTSAEDQAESVETYKVKAVFLKCTNKYITTDGQPDTIYKLRFQKCLEDGSYSANLRSNTSTREPNELEDWVPDLNFERSRPPASGEGRCEVERILSTERSGENLWCFIKWVGYPLEESSWELITDVDSGQLMDQYRKRCFALMALAKRYDHTVPERDEKYFKSPEHRRLALFERQVNTMCAKYNQAPLFVENWVTKESKPAKYEYTLENTFSMKAKCLLEEYKAREPCHCEECPTEEKCCCGKDFHYKQDGIKLSQLHRTYTFIECSSACRCYGTGGKCRNRILQYGRQIPLILFRTRRKGWGIFAAERITKGTFICEYVGHIMLYSEAKERQQPRYAYDLGPEAEMTIVAEHRGNESRFVNHSCEPNLEVRSIVVDFEDCPIYRRLGYFATSDIEPGEELTIDYFPQTAKPEKKGKSKRSRRRSTNPCLCEADNCRGVFGPE
ncbi:hypothetical protein QR680_006404 [Steinernema hermaphroditum]|uniref:Histone-lysine N-methyltransferase n=1 Tax=Steinernema hermaphroditum TaxID=289476 RepID=A0AA39HVF7_9BILA|nr:hypothetical protein QR680_006404 [Steinernema hermaphroditum]